MCNMRRASAAILLLALLAGCLGGTDAAELPLAEDFSGSCEWPTSWDGVKRGECADGVYRFELSEPGGPYTAWREVEPSSFAVEVEGTVDLPIGGRADRRSVGLGCWTGVGGSGYLFTVSGDGRAIVFEERPATGLTAVFEQTTPLPAFRLPARLRARCTGGPSGVTLSFSVNGAPIEIPAISRPSGAFSVVGFAAWTDDPETTIVLDDFAARAL